MRLLLLVSLCLASCLPLQAVEQELPNILWLTTEDHGPHLGCYGDNYATTPNLDSLASEGMLYLTAWSCAPVCAPARTAIISGMYPPSTGGHHMRSFVPRPDALRMYPEYLKEAGYYCTNNSKEDYNLPKPQGLWDESSRKAHWKNRKEGQPFFAIFNMTVTHESRIRRRPHKKVHDPDKVKVPKYHPDTPEVRQDWAQYHDKISEADAMIGEYLKELDEAGLTDDTIVFFYADHGPGLPRSKRFPYNSGLQVPFIVRFPKKWKHLAPKEYTVGGKSDRPINFVDLAPTVLSIIGKEPPEYMQGKAFAGKYQTEAPEFTYGFRGRMDERYDCIRSVTDGRYVYLRNYLPHLPHGQHVAYMFQTPTTQVWYKLFQAGELNAAQSAYWQPKPPEELYDLKNDPDEVKNLARSPEHQEILAKLREANTKHLESTLDVGFLPEAEMHHRAAGDSPYDMARETEKYPFEEVFRAAEFASARYENDVVPLTKMLAHQDSAVRYWATLGFRIRGQEVTQQYASELTKVLQDENPSVRIAAAEALGTYGSEPQQKQSVEVLVDIVKNHPENQYLLLQALNVMDRLEAKVGLAENALEVVQSLPNKSREWNGRSAYGIPRLKDRVVEQLNVKSE